MLELLLAQLAPYMPYILGFLVKAILDALGVKVPLLPTGPDGKPAPLPAPIGKGGIVLWLADLWRRYREAPQTLTEQERAELIASWHITPDEQPKP